MMQEQGMTGAPLPAAVRRPWSSTVKDALVYEPAVTAVSVRAMIPLVRMGPPESPAPVSTQVTVPLVAGAFQEKPVGDRASTVRRLPAEPRGKTAGVLATLVPPIRSPNAPKHTLGTKAERAVEGVRAVRVSVPACASALVDRQTLPATVVVA